MAAYQKCRERKGLRLLEKSARGALSDEQLARLSKGVDIVGDIAILRLRDEFENGKFRIARGLMDVAPRVKVVVRQVGPVESEFRTRRLEWLAGEYRFETVHREFGCQYVVDLNRAYFSPRLSYERKRIADLVSPGECVLNFFAGVGCFSIMIAKHAHPSRIYSLDLNRIALRYHAVNNTINRVREKIELICGDANRIASTSLIGCANRVLLPLPELALDSIEAAKHALKGGHGMIHCYLFVDSSRRSTACELGLSRLAPTLERLDLTHDNVEVRVVRSTGPCRYQVCADISA